MQTSCQRAWHNPGPCPRRCPHHAHAPLGAAASRFDRHGWVCERKEDGWRMLRGRTAVAPGSSAATPSIKEPVEYLRERVERSTLGEAEIRARLATHVVPFDALNVGGYAEISTASDRTNRIRANYEAFLNARAECVLVVMKKLCNGEPWTA